MTGEPDSKAMPSNLGEEVCMGMKAPAVCRPVAGAAHTRGTGRVHLCRGALPPLSGGLQRVSARTLRTTLRRSPQRLSREADIGECGAHPAVI